MKRIALWIVALALAAPASADGERPEVLLGISTDLDAGKVTFEVASNGCTTRKDFRAKRDGDVLTLFRLRRDACKAAPQRMKVDFTLEELGLTPHTPFTLGNKLIANENLAPLE